MKRLSTIQQSYIETIHQLCEENPRARTKEIADALGVRMASATEVVQSLAASGLVDYEKRLGATLTKAGLDVATELQKRHAALAEFFLKIGCGSGMAEEAACAVEHSINSEIADLLIKHLSNLDKSAEHGTKGAEYVPGSVNLDHAAATPPLPAAIRAFADAAVLYPGNPESSHALGRRSAKALAEYAENLLAALGAGGYGVFWTSSATEAIRLAVEAALPEGVVGGSISVLATSAEHPALDMALRSRPEVEVVTIPLLRDGGIDLDALSGLADTETALIATHHVNNETGALQDLEAIGEAFRKRAPNARFLVDTAQSAGKLPIPWKTAGIDVAFVGGHKTGAPSGGALIYKKEESKTAADFHARLSAARIELHSIGRPDTPVVAALATALVSAENAMERRLAKTKDLNAGLRALLPKALNGVSVEFPVPLEKSSPYILSILLPPLQGEILARMLSDKGVMVSAGSACEAWKTAPSRPLLAMGFSKKVSRTAIRVGFGFDSTENDVERLVEALKHSVEEY